MHTPSLVGWLLVLLCAATGGYCLTRSRGGSPAQRVTARCEALMAVGMAVMALPASVVPPPAWSPWVFTAVFGATALWALVRRHPHHAVGALAMVYMALAMVGMPDMAGHPAAGMNGMAGMAGMAGMTHSAPAGVPLLTGLLLAYYAVYVLAAGARLVPGDAGAGPRAVVGAERGACAGPPVVLRACQVAMGLGMLAMLLAL
ncbi:DUF5134 domain-containing protein [Streptomyces diastatochromogenes]|uniref:DUF5134 domain-containing protein n=1 Tax=Streptomyces diastatochromogenes TaxID=42236 RepID=UPI002F26BE0D